MRGSTVTRRSWLGWFVAAGSGVVAGCGGGSRGPAYTEAELSIEEIARIFRAFRKGKKPPPKGLKEVLGYEQGYPDAVASLRSGDVVVNWGAGLSDARDAATRVLAYRKDVPARGGEVLMQDGSTRTMTAEEFKSAPPAAK